jgi:hypothetical protein
MSIQVNLSIKEVYKLLCPKCKKELEKLVKDKMASELAKQVLEGKDICSGKGVEYEMDT